MNSDFNGAVKWLVSVLSFPDIWEWFQGHHLQLISPLPFVIIISSSSTCNSNRGARGVMVIIVGNGHDDMSSNPGQD